MPDAPPSYEQSTAAAGGFYPPPPNAVYSPPSATMYPPLPPASGPGDKVPTVVPIVTTRTQVQDLIICKERFLAVFSLHHYVFGKLMNAVDFREALARVLVFDEEIFCH